MASLEKDIDLVKEEQKRLSARIARLAVARFLVVALPTEAILLAISSEREVEHRGA